MSDKVHSAAAGFEMVKLQFSLILACVAGQLFAANPGEEWTRFRGPNGTGISSANTVPTHWTKADYNWFTPLAGDGSSSPVVWGPNIFVTANDREKSVRSIVCVESKNGKIRWRRDYPYEDYRLHRDNDFASSTPVVDGHGVVVLWSTPKQLTLTALDLDGKPMWQRDLRPYVAIHGSASSPIIAGGMVVLANDQMHP